MQRYMSLLVIFCLVFCFSCKSEPEIPDFVTVQHILISFEGSGVPDVTRSLEEAEKLARELLERAQAGEDFDALVKEYTNDSHPGIYKMANLEENADMEKKIFFRGGMVKAFGDVGFSLKVGEIGMTDYSPEESKYGYHIIKRLE